jgi:hypothetical protein
MSESIKGKQIRRFTDLLHSYTLTFSVEQRPSTAKTVGDRPPLHVSGENPVPQKSWLQAVTGKTTQPGPSSSSVSNVSAFKTDAEIRQPIVKDQDLSHRERALEK